MHKEHTNEHAQNHGGRFGGDVAVQRFATDIDRADRVAANVGASGGKRCMAMAAAVRGIGVRCGGSLVDRVATEPHAVVAAMWFGGVLQRGDRAVAARKLAASVWPID